jgi:putative membrane protein
MFWSLVIEPPGRRRLNYGSTMVLVVTAAVLSGLPGALIALAPRPLYPGHAEGAAARGLMLLQDQQLAGIVMWIPGRFVYLVAVAFIFLKWLQRGEKRRARIFRRAALPLLVVGAAPLLLGDCDDTHARNAAK